ncbi:hypothetical protein EST92_26325 [Streptomyces sp. TM32]|uniref:hypothetical protein n=1 Tax=Streptomyces sp. TM32 TaxID=1652669 RepID=UPI00101291DB|nr:hypothetical protein [Streptomyces sp. TM32]RXS68753.1 hypothetical protein EST92_26325 [Streptomyces sp. TM32]
MSEIPPVLTMTAVSTIEVTDQHDQDSADSWVVIETAEQGQLLLNLPGPMADALTEGTSLPSNQPGPGRLVLTDTEINTYRSHIVHRTAVAR